MSKPPALETLLNPEQLAAATAGDGPLLVLAAAGTGKTRTLVYRVAHLVGAGIRPEELLLLTFTNRAAREMVDRARDVVGAQVGNVWSGTFHHICNRMLRRYGNRLGYAPDFNILDRDDSLSLIDQCLKALKLKHKHFPKRDVLMSWIGGAANRQCPVGDMLEALPPMLDVDPAAVQRVADAYQARKRQLDAMDFDDLLVNGLALLQTEPDVCERYQRHFRHVLVDEYQDTNILQAKFVDLLSAYHRNLMVVGDDFQCIYAWRGADYRNILAFPERYPDARIVKLERNYRSRPEILSVANACIAGNPKQFRKTLRPIRESRGRRPFLHILRDGEEQAQIVRERIHAYLADGYRADQIAVLYRAHFHSIELQVALARAGLPYHVTSGVGVFEQAHVKDLLAFLRVAESPLDRLAFERLLRLLPGVGPQLATGAWERLGGRFDACDAAARNALRERLRPAAREAWAPLDALLAAYHKGGETRRGDEAAKRFVEDFYAAYAQRSYDDAERRVEDLNEVAIEIGRADSVAGFLREVALLTNVDLDYRPGRAARGKSAVRLSTVHQAKGLEWPVVLVLWAVEGMFPSTRALGDGDDDAEERRLFYVAVTRAADALDICVPQLRRMRDGGCFYCRPSRFVNEIPHDLVRTVFGPGGGH